MLQASQTHFGFETVEPEEKTRRVRGVFDAVASRYDLMNDVMSLGAHRLWKRRYVAGLRLRDGMEVLDLAGGTGDIAFGLRERAALRITVCDINAAMLEQGRARALDRGITDLRWLCGNAEALPLPSHAFDRVSIAFGIRNVTDIEAALGEIHRVLKPGGQFACLEFSEVKSPALKPVYERYSFDVIPRMGRFIGGDEAAYLYLVESIRRFPNQTRFKRLIEQAGFAHVRYHNLSGGIVAIHTGWKL